MFKTVLFEVSPRGVATITLNRPEKGNAFNSTMLDELGQVLGGLSADANVRCAVLRAGGKHFCVGADFAGDADAVSPPKFDLTDVLEIIDTIAKPTIAVVEGGCVGGGLAFVACCDVVLVTEKAFFSIPELRVGMVPTLAPLFIRAIGQRAFRRYGFSGERFDAAEALRIGFAHQICNSETLRLTLDSIADAFLHSAPNGLAELKRLSAEYSSPSRNEIFPPKQDRIPFNDRTEEAREGVAAFLQKRKPSWYRP